MLTIRIFTLFLTCLMLTCRALQGAWSSPVDITPAGENTNQPKLAVVPNGGAVAVFENFTDGAIQASVLSPCGNIWTPTSDAGTGVVFFSRVAVDANGNAVAIWNASSGPNTLLQGATLAAGSLTWVPTTDLNSTTFAGDHDIAMSPTGDAVAVWADSTGVIEAATLPAGSSVWVPATSPLSPVLQTAQFPNVDIDPNGNAVAVWRVTVGLNVIIQGAVLASGSSTWVSTTDLTSGVDFVGIPLVTVDAAGNALAVWTASDAFFNSGIQAARLPFGSTVWVPINDVVPFQGFGLGSLSLAMNPSGEAIVLWTEFGLNASVRASLLAPGSSTWVPTDLFVPNSSNGEVAIDPAGNAAAVWEESSGPFTVIQTASLPSGTVNWVEFTTFTAAFQSFEPAIGKDNFGNTVATWGVFDNVNATGQAAVNLVSNPFESTVAASPTSVPADGVTPSIITVTLRDCAGQPQVDHAVTLTALNGSSVISPPSGLSDALGQVTFTVTDTVAESVTYQARDATNGITIEQTATVQFGVGPLPPSNFHGKILPDPCHRCLRLHLLTWCPSPDPTVVSYRIYEDGQVIATTGRKVQAAIIPDRLPNVSYTYTLVAVNAAGEESTPLTITSPARPQSSSCEDSCRCRCR